jgi:6-pyruvoyltetrahydropterin/6-carboxytetrahydropterin synthase
MYTLAVRRNFIARHALVGGDWGSENLPHAHAYLLELQLEGGQLNEHGYLVDILDVDRHLDEALARYRDRLLNDLPEFSGLNPSLEIFCRLLCLRLDEAIRAPNLTALRLVLWENETAWAAFRRER